MEKMNEKKWGEVLGNLKGKTFNLEDFENEEKPSKKTIEKIKKAKGILNS